MSEPPYDPFDWARAEANRLRQLSRDQSVVGEPGYPRLATGAKPRLAAALDFLRRNDGGGEFYRLADGGDKSKMAEQYLLDVADVLDQYVAAVESGMASSLPYEVRARVDAATDLMEQVALLLNERDVHPGAPIMLAGAALEAALRSLWEQAGSPSLAGKPGINSYSTALQTAGKLDRQDAKDVTAWSGLRNDAAHGHFDLLDAPRARLMADGINLFMQRRAPRG